MFKKLTVRFIILIGLAGMANTAVYADPDVPEPPEPGELPDPDDLPEPPEPDPNEGTWWDPLGFFSGDDDDHPHDHEPPGHRKHKDK